MSTAVIERKDRVEATLLPKNEFVHQLWQKAAKLENEGFFKAHLLAPVMGGVASLGSLVNAPICLLQGGAEFTAGILEGNVGQAFSDLGFEILESFKSLLLGTIGTCLVAFSFFFPLFSYIVVDEIPALEFLKGQVFGLKNQISRLETELSTSAKEKQKLEKDIEQLKDKLAKTEETIQEFSNLAQQRKGELEQIRERNDSLKEKLEEKTWEKMQLESKVRELTLQCKASQEDNEQIKDELENARKELAASAQEYQKLKQSHDQGLRQEKESEAKLTNAEDLLLKQQQEEGRLKGAQLNLEMENWRLEEQVTNLTEELRQAKEDYKSLQQKYEEMEKSYLELQDLQKQLNDELSAERKKTKESQKEIQDLKKKLEKTQEEQKTALERFRASQIVDAEEMLLHIRNQKSQIEQLQQQNEILTEKLRQAIDRQQGIQEEGQQKLEKLQEEMDALREKLQTEISTYQEETGKLRLQNKDLARTLELMKQERDQYCKAWLQQKDLMTRKIVDLDQQHQQKYEKDTDVLVKQIRILEAEKESLHKHVAELKDWAYKNQNTLREDFIRMQVDYEKEIKDLQEQSEY
ncbi:MAG: hypothetical protein Tsb0015_07000 [Simkaniaceae bacterium]